MRKEIFESEDEAREVMDLIWWLATGPKNESIEKGCIWEEQYRGDPQRTIDYFVKNGGKLYE
jgi:hypothetical protein